MIGHPDLDCWTWMQELSEHRIGSLDVAHDADYLLCLWGAV